MFGDEDGDVAGDAQGDGVGGAGVDFDGLAVLADDEPGEEGVILEVVDDDAFELAVELLDDAGEEFVGVGARGGLALEAAVDGEGLVVADDDGEGAFAGDFFEVDDLLFGALR